jgi:hypothetical protein
MKHVDCATKGFQQLRGFAAMSYALLHCAAYQCISKSKTIGLKVLSSEMDPAEIRLIQ